MELSLIFRRLWRLRILVALGVLVAAVAAVLSVAHVSLSPFEVQQQKTQYGAAQATFYVDTKSNTIETNQIDTTSLVSRAQIFARFMNSGVVRDAAARKLGIQSQAITVSGPNPDVPGQQSVQPAAQQRANQLLGRGSSYSVFVDTEQNSPTVTIFTQAPNGAEAGKLASAMIGALAARVQDAQKSARPSQLAGLADELKVTEKETGESTTGAERRQLRRKIFDVASVIKPLGSPVAGDVSDQTRKAVAVGTFAGVLIVWCILLLLVAGLVNTIRRRP
jgi:hypothetical protein